MTFDEFFHSTQVADRPPFNLSLALQALWYDKRNGWQQAHEFLGDGTDPESAWVHAYLHRREGDMSNARYWYDRAKQPECTSELDAEWRQIAGALLQDVAK
jgi:hypothetical protein